MKSDEFGGRQTRRSSRRQDAEANLPHTVEVTGSEYSLARNSVQYRPLDALFLSAQGSRNEVSSGCGEKHKFVQAGCRRESSL